MPNPPNPPVRRVWQILGFIMEQGPRVDPTVAAVERLREERERRRQAQEEAKNKRAHEVQEQVARGRVGDLDFQKMIDDYRERRVEKARQHHPPDALKINICVRKRPINAKEVTNQDYDSVSVYNPEVVVHDCKLKVDGITKYLVNSSFFIDHAFSEDVSTDFVYYYTAKPLVDFVMEKGGQATVFAYGQTGSGKTYTMSQIQQFSAHDVFAYLNRPEHSDKKAYLSFFEIYGNRLLDLLNHRERLELMEDANHKIQIRGIFELGTLSEEELVTHIARANQYCSLEPSLPSCRLRTTSATEVHDQSSRSHAICFIAIKDSRDREYGKLALIDLAGSERASETKNHNRQKRLEGAEINKSLLALKECIRALDSNSSHIPYRASQLTKVLRDSFQGHARTAMICTVSPSASSADHTLNTLRYADRIKEQGEANDGMRMPAQEGKEDYVHPHPAPPKVVVPPRRLESKLPAYPHPAQAPRPPFRNDPPVDEEDTPDSNEMEELNDIDLLHQSLRIKNKNKDERQSEELQELHKTVALLMTEEDKLLQLHLRVIKESAKLLTDEGSLLKEFQNSEEHDIDKYVSDLSKILSSKLSLEGLLQKQLERFKKLLKREEDMSSKVGYVPEY